MKSIINGIQIEEFKNVTSPLQLFHETIHLYPHKTALIFNETTISYQQLEDWSNFIAQSLINLGVKPTDKIGLWLPRGFELHATLLGIIKAGATYIPFDKEMPKDRITSILAENKVTFCFTSNSEQHSSITFIPAFAQPKEAQIIAFDYLSDLDKDRIFYIIYTSGSTGLPKGVPISHCQVANLILSENYILSLSNTDFVYQGFSISFDMFIEETWISYSVGATLVIADVLTTKSIDDLGNFLQKSQITVLHAVPSILALIDTNTTNIPSLRLINSGGEPCTTQVVNKWARENTIFFNSYGPTETTVSTTFQRLYKGDKITVGNPLPNYNLAIVDEKLNPVEIGQTGELVISGIALSQGYINRPELTASKFLLKPDSLHELLGDRIYLSGDRAVLNSEGGLEIVGRMDDQVKVRGYRIELGEIESQIQLVDEVLQVCVVVKKIQDIDHLVAYVVSQTQHPFVSFEKVIRAKLVKQLPNYMIPSYFVPLNDLPRLSSGKINKKELPSPIVEHTLNLEEQALFAPEQQELSSLLKKSFPNEAISPEKDFFNDLGGHSLLAAYFVTLVREETSFTSASIQDIYLYRPIKNLFNKWQTDKKKTQKVIEDFKPVSGISFWLCSVAQSISLFFIFGLLASQIFIPYLGYYYMQQETENHFEAGLFAILLLCIVPITVFFISILMKWLVVGKFKAGKYPLWGSYYFKWWLVRSIQRVVPIDLLNGTTLFPLYLRLLGVKVDKSAQISNFKYGAEDLIEIGANVTISSNAVLDNATVENGYLILGKITLNNHSYLGSSSVVGNDCTLEEFAELRDLSALLPHTTILSKNIWEGSPAVFAQLKDESACIRPNLASQSTYLKFHFIFLGILFLFPLILLIPYLPTLISLIYLDDKADSYDFSYIIYTPLFSILFIFLFLGLIIALYRLIQHNITAGEYPIFGKEYLKKWFADQLMNLSLSIMHPLYATVFISPVFRLLGSKIGDNTEISTASNVSHGLLAIGKESFIADAVSLGEFDIRNQKMYLEKTIIGNQCFVGNSAMIPQGTIIEDGNLIGVLSIAPTSQRFSENPNIKNWFGSPPLAMPQRDISNQFSKTLTYFPTKTKKMMRGIVEFLRILIPQTVTLAFSIIFIAYSHDLIIENPWWEIILLFPLYFLVIFSLPCFLVTFVLKWIFVGKYKTEQVPMWSNKVWRSEAITSIYESLAVPFLLNQLRGTIWLPFFLRFLGVKIGKRVYLNTTDFTEFDLISIGTDTALNEDSGPQTHLFEDRVMKIGKINIGERCSIGASAIILYDTKIENEVSINALSLVMKGEVLKNHTHWAGSPVQSN